MPKTTDHAPQAVGKIVIDTARFHWNHADEPSDPLYFT
jgi:hypothetical protein